MAITLENPEYTNRHNFPQGFSETVNIAEVGKAKIAQFHVGETRTTQGDFGWQDRFDFQLV